MSDEFIQRFDQYIREKLRDSGFKYERWISEDATTRNFQSIGSVVTAAQNFKMNNKKSP